MLQFILHFAHTNPLGKRRVNLHRFKGDSAPFFWFLDMVECSHIVEAVRQLHQQHTHVIRHGEHKFSKILSVEVLIRINFNLRQLGHTIDHLRDLVAKQLLDFIYGCIGVLDRVVQKGRHNCV